MDLAGTLVLKINLGSRYVDAISKLRDKKLKLRNCLQKEIGKPNKGKENKGVNSVCVCVWFVSSFFFSAVVM